MAEAIVIRCSLGAGIKTGAYASRFQNVIWDLGTWDCSPREWKKVTAAAGEGIQPESENKLSLSAYGIYTARIGSYYAPTHAIVIIYGRYTA